MSSLPYTYSRLQSNRYIFISVGRKRIAKVVEFASLGRDDLVNLSFGDLRPDDTIDDRANSNNGDIIKVLSTVIAILQHFTTLYPRSQILFKGSTPERTHLYDRILRSYYHSFSQEFAVARLQGDLDEIVMVPYDPLDQSSFFGFVIKRIY